MVTEELLLVVRSNTAQAVSGLKGVENSASQMVQNVGRQMSDLGSTLTRGLTVPIVGAAVASVKLAMDFETGMAQIAALVGVGAEDMKLLEAGALEMGRKYGIAATDAAGGLFFLTSAGLDAATALETLEVVSMASAAGLGEMEDLSNSLTTVMANFGMTAEEAMDKFIMAARRAKADPADLGRILNQNAASAASVGMNFDDLAGITAFLTTVTGDAAASGTAMGGMLNKIVKPSEMAIDALDSIGWSADEFKEKMAMDLPGALRELDEAFAGSDLANGAWIGKVFEDSEAIKGVQAILNQTGDYVDSFAADVADSAGLTQEAWGIMSGTSAVKVQQAIEGMKSALIPLGDILIEVLIPYVEDFTELVGELAEKFGELDEAGQKQVLMFAGIAAVVGPALKIVGMVITALTTLNPIVLAVAAVVGVLAWAFHESGVTFDDVREKFATLVASMMEKWAPLQDWFVDHLDDFKEIWKAATDFIMEVWSDVWEWLEPFLADMFAFIETEAAEMVAWFQDNWPKIKETILTILAVIEAQWKVTWPIIRMVIENVWRVIRTIVTAAMEFIRGIIGVLMGIITLDWKTTWNGIKDIFSGVWTLIKGLLFAATGALKGAILAFLSIIEEAWGGSWDGIGDKFSAIWESMANGVGTWVGLILENVAGMVNGIISGINSLIEKINEIPGVNIGTIGNVNWGSGSSGGGGGGGWTPPAGGGSSAQFVPQARGRGADTPSVNVYVETNADPIEIGREVAWQTARRTS